MDDRRLETMIGQLLRAGVLLAAATVLAGGVFYLAGRHASPVNYHTFRAGGPDTRTLAGIVHAATKGESAAIMQAGLLLLILTPVARVAVAVVGFLLERDLLYVSVSLIVLAILVCSMLRAT